MQTHANIKYLKISARKLRLSADLVRGSRVVEAEQILAATPKKAALMVRDALKSAVANAENNHNARKSALRIASIKVDEGAKLKRARPRSRGMTHPILHRTAHLSIVVSDEAAAVKKAKKPARAYAKTAKTTKPTTTEETK